MKIVGTPPARRTVTALVLSVASLATVSPAFAGSPLPRLKAQTNTGRYIVQLRDTGALSRRTCRLALRGKVSRLGRTIAAMNCAIVEGTPAQIARLQADSQIISVTPDRAVHAETLPPLDDDRVAIGADIVNGYSGYVGSATGAGIGVAVIDSGIAAFHPDLFLRIAGFKDFVNGYNDCPYDDYGHGTHVAGLVGGSGFAGTFTGASRNYRGVAPATHFVGLKVLDANGVGRISDVIAALDWCIANKERYNLRVVNLSLSASVTGPAASDPLCQAAERAVDAGLVVIASAGNNGGLYGTVGAPGNDPKVITVGASNTRGTKARGNDQITSFTGRGPTAYDVLIKPDIVAPGNDLVSLRAPGATIDTLYAAQTRVASSVYYSRLTGTSMSAALVSGAVAAMLDANDKLTPNAVKASLMYTAQVLSGYDPVTEKTGYYDPFAQGTGELNVAGAVQLARRIEKNTGFIGTLPVSSLIAGQIAPWAGATIPGILLRPSLVWSGSLIFGGNTGLTIEDARTVWGSNVVWGGGVVIPPKAWEDSLIYGDNVVWGGGWPPPPRLESGVALVWGNNVGWGGGVAKPPLPSHIDLEPLVNGDNVVWGGGVVKAPSRIVDDPTFTKVGGDTQTWGGAGLLTPDSMSGLTP